MLVSELTYERPAPRQLLLMKVDEPDALVASYSKGPFHRRLFLYLTESDRYYEVVLDFGRAYRIECEGSDDIDQLEEIE